MELNAADIQILFEAGELQEVGQLERTDVPASLADLALEIADDLLEVRLAKARVKEFIPKPFSIITQTHALAGQTAVERVSLLDTRDHEL